MILLSGLLTGAFVYLLAGALTGNLPVLALRRPARPQISGRQIWLIQAGADLTPHQFVLGSVFAGVVAFGLLALAFENPAVAVVPAVVVGFLPRAWFGRRRAARLREMQQAWPDGLRDLIASISAGLSLHQGLTALATSGPEPLRRAFSRYPQLARMLGTVPALENIKEELADPTSDRVIEVLILAHERGGHTLSEILRDLATSTTKDLRTQEEITTDALEQKINARAVFVLPWLVLLFLTTEENFARFYRSPLGFAVILLGAAMSLLGMWIVGRLARDPVEQRVFGAASSATGGGGTR